MAHRFRRWLPVLGAFMALASACGDNVGGRTAAPDEAPGRPVAVDEASLRPPGRELAPGVEVQTGSALVGTSMPNLDHYQDPGSLPENRGWQAVLLVEGDPIEVWGRYVAHLGVDDDRADAPGSCVVQAVRPTTQEESEAQEANDGPRFVQPVERFLSEPPIDGENRIVCHATVPGVTMALVMGAMPCLDYQVPDPPCPFHSASHLYINVLDPPPANWREEWSSFGADRLRRKRNMTPMPSPDPGETTVRGSTDAILTAMLDGELVSRLPKEGERYDDELDYFLDDTDVALVPEGGRSLVAPAMILDCNSGLVALLEVPGTPAEVLDMFDPGDRRETFVQGTDAEGRSWAGAAINSAGGHRLRLLALDTADGMSTVLITECG
ncbi:MAG TPA: hypothetical protein VGR26_06710, partial [Acidimicrobiales bacterium]|nr:hypothetical protein [Acidimicrobiales bacterium]